MEQQALQVMLEYQTHLHLLVCLPLDQVAVAVAQDLRFLAAMEEQVDFPQGEEEEVAQLKQARPLVLVELVARDLQ